jgi:hypothetical protein
MRANTRNVGAVCEAAVIAAYSAARAQGRTRYEAFVRAVQTYRDQFSNLPANLAGTEVARILLATAQSGEPAPDNVRLRHADGMEYVEPA